MQPPFVFKILPERLRASLYYRRYYPVSEHWYPLFSSVSLKYAPKIKLELVPTDIMHGCIAFTGFYEPELTRRVTQLGNQGGLMIDIGANAGYFSFLWSASRPDNQCIAFEASPQNVELLKRNIIKNQMQNQIEVHPLAAGKSSGKMEFEVGPQEQTGWGRFSLDKTANTIPVDVVRVDEVVSDSRTIELLKIDVEGADTWVLMGCEKLLKAKLIKEIHFEQYKPRMQELGIRENEAKDFLKLMGYKAIPKDNPNSDLVQWMAFPI